MTAISFFVRWQYLCCGRNTCFVVAIPGYQTKKVPKREEVSKLQYYSSAPSIGPVCARQQYRHYI